MGTGPGTTPTVTIPVDDLAELLYDATALVDADDLPPVLVHTWQLLAAQAPDAALKFLQLAEDDISTALCGVPT